MKKSLDTQELYTLEALDKMGALTVSQLFRFLFDTNIAEQFDLKPVLANLTEEGMLKQSVTLNGIVYNLTGDAREMLSQCASQIPADRRSLIAEKSEEYKALFLLEKDYLAQYTEQSNAIVPVFLSLRKGDRILMKVSVIVKDVPTAKKITKNWMKNAHTTYKAVWESISDGEPMPDFK